MGLTPVCLSLDLCVQNKGVGGAKLTGRTRGCVTGRPWPLLWGLGADDAHMTHGPGSGHSGKSALGRENENQDLELHLGAGAPGPGVPGYVREEDFHLHATCPGVAALVPLHHRQSSGFFPRGGRAH